VVHRAEGRKGKGKRGGGILSKGRKREKPGCAGSLLLQNHLPTHPLSVILCDNRRDDDRRDDPTGKEEGGGKESGEVPLGSPAPAVERHVSLPRKGKEGEAGGA